MPDPDPDPRKFFGSRMFNDGTDSIMSAAGAFLANPQFSDFQIHVVVDHQQTVRPDVFPLHERGHRFSAQIHISLRLLQKQRLSSIRSFQIVRRTPVNLLEVFFRQTGGKTVEHHESDIMAGVPVFRSRITQTRDENSCSKIIWHSHDRIPRRSESDRTGLLFLFAFVSGFFSSFGSSFLFADDFRFSNFTFSRSNRFRNIFHDRGRIDHVENDQFAVVQNLDTFRSLDLRHMETFTQTQRAHIDFDVFRQSIRQTFHFKFVNILFQHTAQGSTGRCFVTRMHGNRGADHLVAADFQEVDVFHFAADEVILNFLDQREHFLIAFFQREQIQFKLLEGFPLGSREIQGFGRFAMTVDHSGNMPGGTETSDRSRTQFGTRHHIQYMFLFCHFLPSFLGYTAMFLSTQRSRSSGGFASNRQDTESPS
nr:MAG TPA: hypothetical protein [Caudoviricetes sp.]